jgi:capsule polysaccharide export protein KpsE/RkpR
LSTAEENNLSAAEDASDSIEIPIADILKAIWQRRRWLAKIIGLGAVAAIAIALLIPKKYTATAQLMPPDQQTLSSTSLLSALSGAGPAASLAAGGLMSTRSPGGTFIGIMSSQTAQDDIIDRFDLRRVYHCKYYIDARKILTINTTIDEDKKSGIISISVTDRDPKRARDIAEAYVEELDKLVNSLSTSSARREREFLEQRIKSLKNELDASSVELSQFSSRNATLDIQKQGEATVEAAGKLQGELITAQSDLSGLKAMYTEDNIRVRQVQAQVNVLQSQLHKMGGEGEGVDSGDIKVGQLMPSIRKLPLLGVTYADLYSRVVMRESLYETLTKQYELARVEEAKEIPPIKVLDEPQVPERKSSPHRSIIVLLGVLISAFAGIVWIVAIELWKISHQPPVAKAV